MLEIVGDPATGIRFVPKGTGTSVDDFREEMKALASLAKTFVVEPPRGEDENAQRRESTCVDSDNLRGSRFGASKPRISGETGA